MTSLVQTSMWTRSSKGVIAGVCQGIGERLDVSPLLIRLLWLGSVFFFGVGLFFYLVCAICLPVEGREQEIMEPKLLGVCYRLSLKTDLDLGLLRVLAVIIAVGSFGTTVLAYIVAHLLLSNPKN